MTVTANIAARTAAETVCELIVDEIAKLKSAHGPDAVKVFFGKLREVFAGELTVTREPPPPKPMNDAEARAFEEEMMPFGKHKGTPIAEVELGYLDWIVEQPEDFKTKLSRYLLSERVKREREAEREDDDDV